MPATGVHAVPWWHVVMDVPNIASIPMNKCAHSCRTARPSLPTMVQTPLDPAQLTAHPSLPASLHIPAAWPSPACRQRCKCPSAQICSPRIHLHQQVYTFPPHGRHLAPQPAAQPSQRRVCRRHRSRIDELQWARGQWAQRQWAQGQWAQGGGGFKRGHQQRPGAALPSGAMRSSTASGLASDHTCTRSSAAHSNCSPPLNTALHSNSSPLQHRAPAMHAPAPRSQPGSGPAVR